MTNERYKQVDDEGGGLTPEELKAGWHFCMEFDGLLTDGEMYEDDGITCICGFDRRKA